MNQAQSQSIAKNRGNAEQRAFPRHALTLGAILGGKHGNDRRRCKIRDFCNGGMLLTLDQATGVDLPAVGEQIRITTRYPENSQGATAHFSAQVMRRTADGIGVSLINPDPEALQVLITCSEAQHRQSQADTTSRDNLQGDHSPEALIRTCHQKASRAIEELAREIKSALNRNTGTVVHDDQQAAHRRIHQIHEDFSAQYRQRALARIEEQLALVSDHAIDHRDAAEPEFLTLVGEQELEDWLFVSDLAGRIEADHKLLLADLEARLGRITGESVNHQNNPFGPQVLVQAFQDTVKLTNLPGKDREVCFDMLKPVLSNWTGVLCGELNDYLNSAGICPDISRYAPRKARESSPEKRMNDGKQHRGDSRSDTRDLFDLVNELRNLRDEFGHRNEVLTPSHAGQTLDTEALFSTLTQLQSSDSGAAPSTADHGTSLKARLESMLKPQADGVTKPRIGQRESGIIDLADNLFGSMNNDRLLARSVQSWIHRLEIPLLKLALKDESLFLDPDHVARSVVNNLSRLELYDSPDDHSNNAIHQEIDKLIETIADNEAPDQQVFSRALKKLNLLIRMQNEAYEDNLQEVLAACEQEEQEAPQTPAMTAEPADDPELAEWMQRTRRLRTGDWLLFATDPARPQRLRLAWISKQRDRFAFVNLRGLREATLDIMTLARQLAHGEAVVMDSADEPVLDRAQYTMLQSLHQQLLHETSHDQLTDLLNRREFEHRVQEALDNSRCLGVSYTLCHVDIAQFNIINTTCGTWAGDRLLIEFAAMLNRVAGDTAAVARIGSDEFGILIETDPAQAPLALAEALIEAVKAYRFRHDDQEYPVAVGIGVVLTTAFDSGSEILRAAESSCRTARNRGLNQVEQFHPDNPSSNEQNQTAYWLQRIDQALNEGTLELRCQRIMSTSEDQDTSAVHHSEILLAITDDNGALISPQDLILTAEHYQRMPAIDRWVIETTFRFMTDNPAVLDEVGGFAINISGCSLSDSAFRQFIRDTIATTAVPMERVCFEITETAGISSLSDAADFILETRNTGCMFSLDDFGSGLSSYVYLKNLPVDFLKIDGDFVSDMDNNPADYAVVKSITEIGHFMGKKIIAERVESDVVLQQLREIGVDYVQGYVVERPRRLRELL